MHIWHSLCGSSTAKTLQKSNPCIHTPHSTCLLLGTNAYIRFCFTTNPTNPQCNTKGKEEFGSLVREIWFVRCFLLQPEPSIPFFLLTEERVAVTISYTRYRCPNLGTFGSRYNKLFVTYLGLQCH